MRIRGLRENTWVACRKAKRGMEWNVEWNVEWNMERM